MDIRRTVITLVLIVVTWTLYMKYFAPQPPRQASPPPAAPTPVAKAPIEKPAAAAPEAPTDSKPAEEKVTLETSALRATFSSYGAVLDHLLLKDRRYGERKEGTEQAMDLVHAHEVPPLATTIDLAGAHVAPDAAWTVSKRDQGTLEFSWQGQGVRITKRFSVGKVPHALEMDVTVAHEGKSPTPARVELGVTSRQGEQGGSKGFRRFGGLGSPPANNWEGVCFDEKTHQKSVETLQKEGRFSVENGVRWISVTERYFMMAAAVDPTLGKRGCTIEMLDGGQGTFRASLRTEEQVSPGQPRSFRFSIFAGPKLLHELDAVTIGGQETKLGEALDYGWWSPISRVMLWILVAVHRFLGNWGVAIIALTLLVRLLMYPLTQKGMRSSKEMAKLKPKMEELQKRYKDDRQRLNQEIMGLYKQHGVNPLGGCLPMLIQFPIWMALYRTLGNAVELYRSKFLWIPDLTAADPYYVTPLLTGVFMFLQQRITPMPTDSEQQRMMMYMMPIIFTFMSLWFPAGLTLYILTSTLLGMAQQWWMNRSSGEQSKLLRPARAG